MRSRSVPWALVVVIAFGLGHETHRREWLPLDLRQRLLSFFKPHELEAPSGWSFVRSARSGVDLQASAAEIASLGYAAGYEPATNRQSVTAFEPPLPSEGINFYVSGHAPEAVLMNMKGEVLHRWHHDFHAEWPNCEPREFFGTLGQAYWRRAHLFDNGDLLAVYDGFGLVKLDRASKVIWALAGGYHHDLQVMPDGRIFVLDRKIHVLPRWHPQLSVVEDFVVVLSAQGEVVRRVSLLEAFERSNYAAMLERLPLGGDVFHTNTLQVLDGSLAGRAPAFRKGNVLVCVSALNTVAIVDMNTEAVVWALEGMWVRPHQPELVRNGNMILFDNQGNGGKSRVLEIDPLTQEIVWAYGIEPGQALDSAVLGSCQRLLNGNTLITESTQGRAIEVTPTGRIVWEFYSPHRAGEKRELVANLFEVLRLPPEFPTSWTGGGDGSPTT